MQRKYADPPPQFADIGRWCGFFMSLRGVALGVSAVQHDMKREETVEEAEKNTEWQRRPPKAGVGGSNPFWRATSEQAVYHLLRLFMEKSARAHAAAPPFGAANAAAFAI